MRDSTVELEWERPRLCSGSVDGGVSRRVDGPRDGSHQDGARHCGLHDVLVLFGGSLLPVLWAFRHLEKN
jgi:hypothetical protein